MTPNSDTSLPLNIPGVQIHPGRPGEKIEFLLNKYHGRNKKVNTISDFEITDFLNFKEKEEKWAGVTYNNCRIGLNNFFRYLKVNKFMFKIQAKCFQRISPYFFSVSRK